MYTQNKPIKNTLCRTKLATAISLSILLAGCGSGGDSADDPVTEQPAPPELQSFEGKAADGYLSGALVCLDLDNDSLCGSEEPYSLTGDGGVYEFKDLDATLDLSQVRLLVKIIADQTIDEDNPGVVLTQSYKMSSPPGQLDFVSPITTLIDNQMQTTQGQTQEEAEQVVAQMIGIEDAADVDLTADYVEASGEEGQSKDDYKRLHHVAQAVASAIGVVSANLETQIEGLDDGEKKDALAAIVSNVVESLGEITSAIDETLATGDEVDAEDIATIVESIKETIIIAKEDLDQAISDVKDEREAVASNIKDVLTQQEGIFFLEQDKERFYNEDINKCVVESELGYGNFKVTDGIGEFTFKLYNTETQQFGAEVDEQDDSDFGVYTLGQTGWELNDNDQPTVVNFSDDGVELTMKMPRDGLERISGLEFNIVDEPVATIARDQWVWQQALESSGLTFGEDAKAYFISGELVDNHFVLPVWHGCSDATGALSTENCNSVRFGRDYQTAANFEQLITTEAPSDVNMLAKAFHVYVEDHHELMVSLFKYTEGDKEVQVAKFFKRSYDQSGSANTGELIESVHVAQWQQQTVNGQPIVQLDLPLWLNDGDDDSDRETPFITIQDGQVRQGFMLNKGFTDHKAVAMNKAAMDQVIAGFNPDEALRLELDPAHCGIKSDEPTTEPEPESEPAPTVVSDPDKTSQLVNNSYFINDNDEQVLVNFTSESEVNVSSVEVTSTGDDRHFESGAWTIDADGQLLLEFSDEWVLVNVTEGLGTNQLVVTEQDDSGIQELTFNKVTPLLVSDLTVNESIVLIRDDQCSLTFNLLSSDGSQGGGFIDASECLDISGDMGSGFDFSWSTGAQNEMVLEVFSSIKTQQEAIHLFNLQQDDQPHILMTFDKSAADGTASTEHDFELWKVVQPTQG